MDDLDPLIASLAVDDLLPPNRQLAGQKAAATRKSRGHRSYPPNPRMRNAMGMAPGPNSWRGDAHKLRRLELVGRIDAEMHTPGEGLRLVNAQLNSWGEPLISSRTYNRDRYRAALLWQEYTGHTGQHMRERLMRSTAHIVSEAMKAHHRGGRGYLTVATRALEFMGRLTGVVTPDAEINLNLNDNRRVEVAMLDDDMIASVLAAGREYLPLPHIDANSQPVE